jgi:hypothetical protein
MALPFPALQRFSRLSGVLETAPTEPGNGRSDPKDIPLPLARFRCRQNLMLNGGDEVGADRRLQSVLQRLATQGCHRVNEGDRAHQVIDTQRDEARRQKVAVRTKRGTGYIFWS